MTLDDEVPNTVIYPALEEILVAKEPPVRWKKSRDTVLVGKDSILDSLGLVSLISTVEALIQDRYNVNITLATETAMSRRHSPFRTVGSLADYIEEQMRPSGGPGAA